VCNKAFLLGLFSLFACSLAFAEDFPAPPNAEVSVVSNSTTSLGLTLAIRKFSVNAPVQDVIEFYRNHWQEEFAETENPPWQMIGKRIKDEYLNVQVQPRSSNSSWGYLSVSDLPNLLDNKSYKVPSANGFPVMSGSQILDFQESRDPGKTGRVLMIKNNFSPKSNQLYYKKHFQNKNWDVLLDEAVQPRDQGFALFVRKGNKTVNLTISVMNGETMIVANQVDKGLLR